MSDAVYAVIVLYNPDYKKLTTLISDSLDQFEKLVVVDNTPRDFDHSYLPLLNVDKIHYLDLGENLGIAIAQNRGIQYAIAQGAEYIMTLDQDSGSSAGMVLALLQRYKLESKTNAHIAAIGPTFIDEKTGEKTFAIKEGKLKIEYVPIEGDSLVRSEYLISSGMLIPVAVLHAVGLMDENLFIDWVDTEWCMRANRLGYFLYIDPKVEMNHSIGDSSTYVMGKNIMLHSDFRNYYKIRNSIYLAMHTPQTISFKITQIYKTIPCIIFYSWVSPNKLNSFKLLFRAVFDGVVKNMDKGYFAKKRGV